MFPVAYSLLPTPCSDDPLIRSSLYYHPRRCCAGVFNFDYSGNDVKESKIGSIILA
ncbi:MAG: hypothetical protein F6J90_11190 [Moorea sp. SIOASIH]|uniref:hypothetical protein n=1 Tax=Moorena sp. SIOASIH TaxID=2607817 RepID=UPI0013BD46C2|nr:hypothetical protein [Moorena sp. SIOASIH]NEO36841.1 hypothetical protein [Moorena sp. SIOASIH]